MNDDGPGTIAGRLRRVCAFATERLGHSPVSAKPGEAVVLETLDRLLKEQAAGISWSFTAPIGLIQIQSGPGLRED